MSNVIGHNVFNLNHKTRVSWVRIALSHTKSDQVDLSI